MTQSPFVVVRVLQFFLNFCFALELFGVNYENVKSGEKRADDSAVEIPAVFIQLHLADSVFTAGRWYCVEMKQE